jgi:hypothetical protein
MIAQYKSSKKIYLFVKGECFKGWDKFLKNQIYKAELRFKAEGTYPGNI